MAQLFGASVSGLCSLERHRPGASSHRLHQLPCILWVQFLIISISYSHMSTIYEGIKTIDADLVVLNEVIVTSFT